MILRFFLKGWDVEKVLVAAKKVKDTKNKEIVNRFR
jgi:hypothetical protein